jgi:hypothetical protein
MIFLLFILFILDPPSQNFRKKNFQKQSPIFALKKKCFLLKFYKKTSNYLDTCKTTEYLVHVAPYIDFVFTPQFLEENRK